MKKLFSVLLTLSLIVAFAACGDNESGTTVSNPSESSVSAPSVSSEADISDTSEDVSSNTSADTSTDTSTDDGSADFSDDSSDVSDNSETSDTSDVSVPDTPDEKCKHAKTKMVNAKESTCSVKGYSGDTVCNDCGEIVKKGRELSLNDNHNIVFESKSATCTESGYKDKKTCKDCGCEVSKGTIVNALGHDTYTEGNAVKCRRCNKTLSTTSAPYLVDVKYVSKHQPNSIMVDEMPILDRLYGKNKAAQMGDTFVYEVIMSDGGSEGFEIFDTYGCTVTINGNRVEVYITGSRTSAHCVIKSKVADENGEYSLASIRFDTVIMDESPVYESSVILREYIVRQGMKCLNGCDVPGDKRVVIDIEGREPSDWYSEVLKTVDTLAKEGYTEFCYILSYPYYFDIGVYW